MKEHKKDYIEKIRLWTLPKLGWWLAEINDAIGTRYYTEAPLGPRHYACTALMNEEELEVVLENMGFKRNLGSSLKRRIFKKLKRGVEYEEGSWRLLLDEDWQIHVILFDNSFKNDAGTKQVDIYAHKEKRWDTHPHDHYWSVGFDAQEGIDYVVNVFFAKDIPYYRKGKDQLE